jgi:hypothetical protein
MAGSVARGGGSSDEVISSLNCSSGKLSSRFKLLMRVPNPPFGTSPDRLAPHPGLGAQDLPEINNSPPGGGTRVGGESE